MLRVARVATSISLNREFDYLIPESFASRVLVGCRVRIPFGKSTTTGYVVGLSDSSAHAVLKPIMGVEGRTNYLTGPLLELIRWIAEYYCCPVEKALQATLPAAVRKSSGEGRTRLSVVAAEVSAEVKARLPARQASVFDALEKQGPLSMVALCRACGTTAATVRTLEKKGLVRVVEEAAPRNPLSNRTVLPTQPLALNDEQRVALEQIRAAVEARQAGGSGSPGTLLLHGVTGSGKTEVYLQAIAEAVQRGMGAIVLVPEISLTPQTVERFVGRFGQRIAVLHSHLSDGERHDEWHRVMDGGASIVVGARSAVFAPVHNLGLIVVDEEHETSYKQDEAPRYSARDVAVMRGRIENCVVVLGSATPALESWMNAVRGKYQLARLTQRVDGRRMPDVQVVDMRIEAQREGKLGVFSKPLLDAIGERLHRAEQVILFLNRRGFASSMICPKCGFVAACANCSVNLTYHRHDERLRCHLCGDVQPVPRNCPSCADPAFKIMGVGTQRVEEIVGKFFPHAKLARMDADAVTRKDSYDRILGDFRSGRTDILIGTQMIAKGLDFPNVTLVGVLNADLSLHMPDFRAGERTYQLLAQVAGRAGRGEVPGEVIVQTFTPFHPALQAARRNDYAGFCDQELAFRKELNYPPYSHLVCVNFRGKDDARVSRIAADLAGGMRRQLGEGSEVIMSEPSPAPILRVQGLFRYQLIMRSRLTKRMSIPLMALLADMKIPRDVHVTVDVDAFGLI